MHRQRRITRYFVTLYCSPLNSVASPSSGSVPLVTHFSLRCCRFASKCDALLLPKLYCRPRVERDIVQLASACNKRVVQRTQISTSPPPCLDSQRFARVCSVHGRPRNSQTSLGVIKPKIVDENQNGCIDIEHSLHVTLQSMEYSRCFKFLISPLSLSL
jgi:hypothetical protein